MFNFFKKDKDKKIEAIGKQILLFHEACNIGVDEEMLQLPRPMIGAILFFAGAVDNLCQANEIDDTTFAKLSILILESIGFPKDITMPIIKNFYTKINNSNFALIANVEGGKTLSAWLSQKNNLAPLTFGVFVRKWAQEPDINENDTYLFA